MDPKTEDLITRLQGFARTAALRHGKDWPTVRLSVDDIRPALAPAIDALTREARLTERERLLMGAESLFLHYLERGVDNNAMDACAGALRALSDLEVYRRLAK